MAAFSYGQALVADIPFHFHVGDQTYASGRYYFSNASIADTHHLWKMRLTETQRFIMFGALGPGRTLEPPAVSSLIFHKFGNAYFLSQVRVERRAVSQLAVSKRERETAKAERVAETVTLNLGAAK